MAMYGYARVSTREQNEDRQMIALREAGVAENNVYLDKQSGKDFKRKKYQKMLRKVKAGDLICIKSIDRLGRNYEEIQDQWRVLTKEKGADIYVIDMPLLDTRRGKDLVGTLLSDIVLQVLSFVAQNERENIRQRQAEGIAAARARGVTLGRPKKDLPPEFEEVFQRLLRREITVKQGADVCKMPYSTFYDKVREYKDSKNQENGCVPEKYTFSENSHRSKLGAV